MTQDEFSSVSWAAFMEWALDQPEMRQQFKDATGRDFMDSASYVVAFVEWATLNHWGIEHAPPKYRKALEERKQ